jgi:hypothetical protein
MGPGFILPEGLCSLSSLPALFAIAASHGVVAASAYSGLRSRGPVVFSFISTPSYEECRGI